MSYRKLIWLLAFAALLIFGTMALQVGGWGTGFLWAISSGGKWMLPLVMVTALIDSVNPCAFSILLLTIAFLMSLGKARKAVLSIGGLYIAGMFLVYLLIGLGLLQVLHLFNTPHFMAKVGAVLLVAFGGINVINEFFPAFPIKLRIPQAAHRSMATFMEKGSGLAAFLLGALVGLCEFPCTGGPYLAILGMLHDNSTYLVGFGYLLLYNLVFVLPLIAILLVAADRALLTKVETWKRSETHRMRLWGGIAMVVLGIMMYMFQRGIL